MQIKDIIIALLIETSHRIVEEIGLIEAMRIANAYEILIPFTTFITETCGFHFVLSFRLPHDLKTPYLAFFYLYVSSSRKLCKSHYIYTKGCNLGEIAQEQRKQYD